MAAPRASNLHLATPRRAAVLVLTTDEGRRRETCVLLRAGGFDPVLDPGIAPADAERPEVVIVESDDAREAGDLVHDTVKRHPGRRVVVVVPAEAGGAALRHALRFGAAGIVEAPRLRETLVPALDAELAGMIVVPPAARRQLAPRALSHRERQALELVVRGYTNRQIAQELFVAECTVKTHLSSAFAKLETRSRAEAAALFMDPGEGYRVGLAVVAGSEDPAAAHR